MIFGEVATGRRQRWTLVEKLGEGDAGEIYRVESLLGQEPAILKRPIKGGFSSDIIRQSAQIRTEGRILKTLESLLPASSSQILRTPAVVDSSVTGSEYGEGMFLIIEQAPGFSLSRLVKTAHTTVIDPPGGGQVQDGLRGFLENIARQGEVPRLVFLRALLAIIELFERIHFANISLDGNTFHGVIWNDIKPDHLFWDPVRPGLTVIDWGNGQFLEADGATPDRHASRLDDYNQFVSEMGSFLSTSAPLLYSELAWPEAVSPANVFSEGIKPLKDRISELLAGDLESLRELRRQESDLALVSRPDAGHLQQLSEIRERIWATGEMPDRRAALHLYTQRAVRLAEESQVEEFAQICEEASRLTDGSTPQEGEKWKLLRQLACLAVKQSADWQAAFQQAIASGIANDWASAIWSLLSCIGENPLPEWWDELTSQARKLQLNTDADAVLPYVAASRLFFTLQSNSYRPDQGRSRIEGGAGNRPETEIETLVRFLEEEVIKKWKEVEPAPPHSGIEYNELGRLMEDLEIYLPGTQKSLDQALAQPRAQALIVMDAWGRKEFDTARRGLRQMLLWDPHRRRLITADRALQSAPGWLVRVRQGARSGEAFHDYLTEVELSGRELRNQVGPARWLDLILDSLKQLRNGGRPADLLMVHPELLTEIPWFNEYRSRETLSLPRTRPLSLERVPERADSGAWLVGSLEDKLGEGGGIILGEPLDTWVAEARGSSARVFNGKFSNKSGVQSEFAVKLMRPDRVEYALPLFREEAQILTLMRDVPGITRLVECGYLHLEGDNKLLVEDRQATAAGLNGTLLRFGPEEVQSFLTGLDVRTGQGWIPYIVQEKRNHATNLMAYCDAGFTHGRFLPLRESLLLGLQICDILQVAHDRNIVYRDHKILHYYWDIASQGVSMIDWNIARRHPQGLSGPERQFDLVQFSARALHHILTGRAAPGALPLGPNRPEEIEQAAHRYRVQWTYDDERLPNRLKEILESALTEGYDSVRLLRRDLFEVYEQIPESGA